ncbi:MAG: hypothetical protein ACTSW1_03990 [Candidatus Hodarchaeales archaeon]
MLDEFLISQGILTKGRFDLVCFPDYIFFRNHPHKLYREFTGFPRYSVFSRKFTDQNYEENCCDNDFALKALYIIDGSTALTNVQFFFPLTKCFHFSVIGTNLDFTELWKIRYNTLPNSDFRSFQPHSVILKNNRTSTFDKTCHSLPSSYELKLNDSLEPKDDTLLIGSVAKDSDFFPNYFDILRLNLGDLVEYNQRFFPENISHMRKCELVLDELKTFITIFNIPLTLISLYKYTKFFASGSYGGTKLHSSIDFLRETLGYKESSLIHNIKRRKWQQEPWDKLEELIDSQSYIALFRRYR